ncbi:MAG TPA: hypothetical protein VF230_04640 [Acidimicrobiales bacterium]
MRRLAVLLLAGLGLVSVTNVAADAATPPLPEPNVIAPVLPRPCIPEQGNVHEAGWADREGLEGPEYERYPGICQRLRFTYGPILVKPGQNDVLIEPIDIEQPRYDGYLTRFDPDLVRVDGTVPPIDEVHLHHAVWTTSRPYGVSPGGDSPLPGPTLYPFAASGEEKTIFRIPTGYGMPVSRFDDWQLLYMIHSAVPQPTEVYITYDVDFVPKAQGDAAGIKPAYPIWMDVRPSTYPVFNAQKGYGTGGVCTWPKQNCAAFDPFGKVIPGQGLPPTTVGTDLQLPAAGQAFGRHPNFQGGTLILMGGHLHPGGLVNEIDLVRGGVAKRIYNGEGKYWDRTDPTQTGGPPTSWDFSETVVGLPSWGVRVEPGDKLRSNVTYDTAIASVYEAMGIAVAFMAPDTPAGAPTAPGVDAFTATLDDGSECPTGGLLASPQTLCARGWPTHGHLPENDNFGGPSNATLAAGPGPTTTRVDVAAFSYVPGDLAMVSMTGIPQVPLGSRLNFTNEDAAANVYHTITTCAYPCLGATGTAFPLADGKTSLGRDLDVDSSELGIGIPTIGAAKQAITFGVDVTPAKGYQPGEVVTYFCRIHPFMRGAFEVAGS